MHIREYLCREARRITEGSVSNLPASKEAWYRDRPQRLNQYLEMMGVLELPPPEKRTPLQVTVTGTLERDSYTVAKLHFQSLPRLYVTGSLYLPNKLEAPAPGVLYVCGHSQNQKVHYQMHARRFAELGFVVLLVETIQLGEINGYHHGCYHFGWWHLYSRGYTPAGVEMWNGIRAVDLLCQRQEVDGQKIGVTGISGGGAMSWWLGAADERVKVVAPVCGTGTMKSHICDRTVDGHCDCMFFINTYGWDLADVGALIAPRPLLIASADRDGIYSIASVRECYQKVRRVYELLGAEDNISLVETPGRHSYHEISRTRIFSLFLKHLKGVEVPAQEVGDIDSSPEAMEPSENLHVFVSGLPADERTSTIQDSFVPLAQVPEIQNEDQLRGHRGTVIKRLRTETFGYFPEKPCDLKAQVAIEWETGNAKVQRISFESEEGLRLATQLVLPEEAEPPAPAAVLLRTPGAGRGEAARRLAGLDKRCVQLVVETRGVGESSWGDELAWHVRRAAAILGRPIASMRVYDTLRALELARSLSQVNESRVALMAAGEMAAVALYAALLDGNVRALVLLNPPATQDAPGSPDGTGPAIEMLNCLRITDLPQVAGMLWPMELVFLGGRPDSYAWAEELYTELGAPGVVRHLQQLSQWKPSF